MASLQYAMQPASYFAIGAVLSAWATFFVGLRFFCRYSFRIPFGIDDLWCAVAYVVLIGLNITSGILYLQPNVMETQDGHIVAHDLPKALTTYYANHILYFVCMFCCKLSVIFLCLRLFTSTAFRVSAGVVGFFCLAAFVGGLIPFAVGCTPSKILGQSAQWYMGVSQPAPCEDIVALFEGVNLSNFFTNLMVLCLPLPWVWGLNLLVKQRIALSLVFLMGGIGCIISLLRVFLQNSWEDDFETMIGNCSMWSVIEPAICLFAACLPVLRPFLPSRFARLATVHSSSEKMLNRSGSKPRNTPSPPDYTEDRSLAQHNTNIEFSQSYIPPPPPSQSTLTQPSEPSGALRSTPRPLFNLVRSSYNRNNSYRTDRQALLPQAHMMPQQLPKQARYWDSAQPGFDRRPSTALRDNRSWLSDEANTPPTSYYDRDNTF